MTVFDLIELLEHLTPGLPVLCFSEELKEWVELEPKNVQANNNFAEIRIG